ncbi:thioredoxin family protein [Pedobacter frigidisoli]|uniref:thioredoxin family protein n=1 Tax=Pedobacter frigidisoli TaxID=2530455 RepID=UPI00292EFA86|nr:thioredoxin family protein [Pedobacter frigidisoli]
MKKISILLSVLIFTASLVFAQKSNIKFFEGSFKDALSLASKQNKLIFLDAKTTWCVPCKVLADSVFTQKAVADYYNQNFINLSMDMEKGEGPGLALRYGVKAYPTLLYIKPDAMEVSKLVGLSKADTLLQAGQIAMAKKNLITDDEKFYNGPRSEAMVKEFFTNIFKTKGRGAQMAPLEHIAKQEGYQAFIQKKYWEVLPLAGIGSPIGQWFVQHRDEFIKVYGKDVVENRLCEMYVNRISLGEMARKTGGLDSLKQELVKNKIPNADFMCTLVDFYSKLRGGKQAEAFLLADSALKGAKPWQYLQFAKWADFYTVMQYNYRWKAAKWAAIAAAGETDPDLKYIALQCVDDLMNAMIPKIAPSPYVYGIPV